MPDNRRQSVISQSNNTEQKSLRRRSTMVEFDPEALGRRRSTVVPSNYTAGRRRSTVFGRANRPLKPAPLTEEERKKLARDRFRKAVFKVKAMLRFGLPLRAKPVEDTKPQKKLNYENTYQTEPDYKKKFRSDVAEKNLKDVMEDNLKTYKYSRISAPNFSRALSTMVVDRMKELDFPRYKYICNVIIGESKGQSFDFSSRCVWNHTTDSSATATIKSATFFAVATLHAVYLD